MQAVPVDYEDRNEDVFYFLANDVIEADYTLRRFTGAFGNPTGIQLGFQNINKEGTKVSMGGCMGCHGNAQHNGQDFSFLLDGRATLTPATLAPVNLDIGATEQVKEIVKKMK